MDPEKPGAGIKPPSAQGGGTTPTRRGCRGLIGWLSPIIIILLLSVFFLNIPLIQIPWAKYQNEREYDRRQARYDAIVARIKTFPVNPLEPNWLPSYFEVSRDRDPQSVKPLDEGSARRYDLHVEGRIIKAWRGSDGGLIVHCLTEPFGHWGDVWLVYSEKPKGFDPEQRGFWLGIAHATPVNSNWWSVYDNHK